MSPTSRTGSRSLLLRSARIAVLALGGSPQAASLPSTSRLRNSNSNELGSSVIS